MTKIKGSLTICTFLMLIFIGFSNKAMFKSVQADEYFDTYGNISWAEERVHLYNFASFLEDNPDMVVNKHVKMTH